MHQTTQLTCRGDLNSQLLAYLRSCLTNRIDGCNEKSVESELLNLKLILQDLQMYYRMSPDYVLEMMFLSQQSDDFSAIKITQYPAVVNCGTKGVGGTKFSVTIEALMDVAKEHLASVQLYAISSSLYEQLIAMEIQQRAEPQPYSCKWILDELKTNSEPTVPAAKAQAIQVASKRTKSFVSAIIEKTKVVYTCFFGENAEMEQFVAKFNNVVLKRPPFTPLDGSEGSDAGDDRGEQENRRVIQSYHFVAVTDMFHAFSLPIACITNVSQRWQAEAMLLWHDACNLQMIKDGLWQQALDAGPHSAMRNLENLELPTPWFKHYLCKFFHRLVGTSEKSPYQWLTTKSLPAETLEYLARRALGIDCSQLPGHNPDLVQCNETASSCYYNDVMVEQTAGGRMVTWKQYYENLAKRFFDWCFVIRTVEQQAIATKTNKASALTGGLWDNGLISIVGRKQATLKLTDAWQQHRRTLIIRLSESIPRAITVVSISNQGRIVSMQPRTQKDFDCLSLPQTFCNNQQLQQFGLSCVYPNIPISAFETWYQRPSVLARYCLAQPQLDFSEFIRSLSDSDPSTRVPETSYSDSATPQGLVALPSTRSNEYNTDFDNIPSFGMDQPDRLPDRPGSHGNRPLVNHGYNSFDRPGCSQWTTYAPLPTTAAGWIPTAWSPQFQHTESSSAATAFNGEDGASRRIESGDKLNLIEGMETPPLASLDEFMPWSSKI